MYQFTAEWISGSKHSVPDALSRAPVEQPSAEDAEVEEELNHHLRRTVTSTINAVTRDGTRFTPLSDTPLSQVRAAAQHDDEYQKLKATIITGFPGTKGEVDGAVRPYWAMRDRLTIDDDLVVCGPRLVIPRQMRNEVLGRLHDSRQGIQRTKMRARQTVYWPNIDNDIANIIRSCRFCRRHLPSLQKEPMMTDPMPSRVFESVSTDYFHHAGRTYVPRVC